MFSENFLRMSFPASKTITPQVTPQVTPPSYGVGKSDK